MHANLYAASSLRQSVLEPIPRTPPRCGNVFDAVMRKFGETLVLTGLLDSTFLSRLREENSRNLVACQRNCTSPPPIKRHCRTHALLPPKHCTLRAARAETPCIAARTPVATRKLYRLLHRLTFALKALALLFANLRFSLGLCWKLALLTFATTAIPTMV